MTSGFPFQPDSLAVGPVSRKKAGLAGRDRRVQGAWGGGLPSPPRRRRRLPRPSVGESRPGLPGRRRVGAGRRVPGKKFGWGWRGLALSPRGAAARQRAAAEAASASDASRAGPGGEGEACGTRLGSRDAPPRPGAGGGRLRRGAAERKRGRAGGARGSRLGQSGAGGGRTRDSNFKRGGCCCSGFHSWRWAARPDLTPAGPGLARHVSGLPASPPRWRRRAGQLPAPLRLPRGLPRSPRARLALLSAGRALLGQPGQGLALSSVPGPAAPPLAGPDAVGLLPSFLPSCPPGSAPRWAASFHPSRRLSGPACSW